VANERDMSKHIAGSIIAANLQLLASFDYTTYTCHGEGHRPALVRVPSGQANGEAAWSARDGDAALGVEVEGRRERRSRRAVRKIRRKGPREQTYQRRLHSLVDGKMK
jgi:hypothetical protein